MFTMFIVLESHVVFVQASTLSKLQSS